MIESNKFFFITFPRIQSKASSVKGSVKSNQKSIQKSNQKSIQKTLELVRQNNLITISELAQQTGLSEPGIKKHLRKLQQEGLLKRIGPDKGGHWEVLKQSE